MTPVPSPLPYQLQVASRLQQLEAGSWAAFAEAAHRDRVAVGDTTRNDTAPAPGPEDELDVALLRHAYRLEPAAHPKPHAAAHTAAEALGLELPISIYQLEIQEGANAGLFYRPDEIVIGLSGGILSLLTDAELASVLGHELAHSVLWRAEQGRLLVASRLLGALSLHPQTPPPYIETARRFDLATELFADRCGLAVSGDIGVTIAGLVKVTTGLAEVDPHAFLSQATKARPGSGSEGVTHPETALRAWALSEWQAGRGDEACAMLLSPTLDIERLDLLDRDRLEAATRALVCDLLAVDWLRTDDVLAHARQFFHDLALEPARTPRRGRSRLGLRRAAPEVAAGMAPPPPPPAPLPAGCTTETRRYLAYVLLDLATVDPELEDEPLVEALALARLVGLGADFEQIGKRELGLADRTWARLAERAAQSPRVAAAAMAGSEPAATEGATPDEAGPA